MRLFTGISVPPGIAQTLAIAVETLRPLSQLRWSPVENLHITTKFIGAWPEDRLPQLENALSAIPASQPFPVTVSDFGLLPASRHPKIFFAGVQGGPQLTALAASTDQALRQLGVTPEDRLYTAHLTLARVRDENLTALRERIAATPPPHFGAFSVTEFHLYKSIPGSSHSTYSILRTYPVSRAAN